MCLAVPGKIIEWTERESPFAQAVVEFAGVRRTVSMECVPAAAEGDFVLVHAGIAITKIDAEEAARVLTTFAELGLVEADESTSEPQASRETNSA